MATDGYSSVPPATEPPDLCSQTHWKCSLDGIWSISNENTLSKIIFWCFTHYLSRQVVWPAFNNLSEVHSYSGRDMCHVPANFIMQ